MEEQKEVTVNGEKVSEEILEQYKKDPNVLLKQISEDTYKKLDKMHG